MHILLADGIGATAESTAQLLRSRGHTVVVAAEGRTAQDRLRHDATIDVMMVCLDLPGVTGLELCWMARTLAAPPRLLHVIAIAPQDDVSRLEEALDGGADDLVCRPLHRVELLARLRSVERLRQVQQELICRATLDPLTGLHNRRSVLERAALLSRQPGPFCLAMIDIDHFKQVNDRHGHDAGDAVLRGVAEQLRAAAASAPLAGRLGGEEFVLLMPGHTLDAAKAVAERLRAGIARTPLETPSGLLRVTASLGLAAAQPDEALEQTLKQADRALYAAKAAGRNRVLCAGQAAAGRPHCPAPAALAGLGQG